MGEFIDNVLNLSILEIWTDIHGAFAMAALILFGVAITLTISLDKFAKAYLWLKRTMYWLVATVSTLNIFGILLYVPYRAKVPGSPRTILKSSEDTAWIHSLVFEHKEVLAFAPMVLLMVAAIIVWAEGKSLKNNLMLRRMVLFSIITALVFTLIVAAEAVLVTKTAPLR